MQYGLISTNYAVTDSLLYPPYIAATTQFCTHPNIDLEGENVVIDITAQIQLSEPVLSNTVQIPLSENIPECPDCEESLVITSDYYELPNIDLDGNVKNLKKFDNGKLINEIKYDEKGNKL